MLLATPLVAGTQMHLELPLVITTVPLRQRSPLATAHFFLFRLHGRPQLRPHPGWCHKRRTPSSRCLPGWHPSGPLAHSPPLSRGLAWLGLARSGQSSYETRRHVVKSVCVCKHMYLWAGTYLFPCYVHTSTAGHLPWPHMSLCYRVGLRRNRTISMHDARMQVCECTYTCVDVADLDVYVILCTGACLTCTAARDNLMSAKCSDSGLPCQGSTNQNDHLRYMGITTRTRRSNERAVSAFCECLISPWHVLNHDA